MTDFNNKDFAKFFGPLLEGARELNQLLKDNIDSLKEFGKVAEGNIKKLDTSKAEDVEKLNKEIESLKKAIDDLIEAQKKQKETQTEIQKQEAQLAKLKKQNTEASKELTKEIEKQRLERSKQKKAAKEQAKEELGLINTYQRQSKTLNELRNRYKDLAASGQSNTIEARNLRKEISKLDNSLKKIDAEVGQYQRNVGNYANALKGAATQIISVLGATQLLSRGVGAAFNTFRDFGLESAKVQAVSGATAEEFQLLQEQAKELGQSTAFSATQVANLQLELSKLGFSATQIEQSTKSILDFAVATDSDLGRAAEVVASTLNAYNLEASEAARVSDVAAKAFSSSALDIEKFSTAISIVGPAAEASGISVEKTTAILGKIVDAGIDASTAGTALRNVFIDIADKGISLEDALGQIANSQDKLTEANELFGKRGAVVAKVIADNVDEIDKLNQSLLNAEGAAAAAADTIGDTLDGDIKKLQSAFEGLILEGGALNDFFRNAIQLGTKFLTFINDITGGTDDLEKSLTQLPKQLNNLESELLGEQAALEGIKNQLEDTNISTAERSALIQTLNDQYGQYLPAILTEETSYDDLAAAIDQASAALVKKIILNEEERKISEFISSQIDKVKELTKEQNSLQKELADQSKVAEEARKRYEGLLNTAGLTEEEFKNIPGLFSDSVEEIQEFEGELSDIVKAQDDLAESFESTANAQQQAAGDVAAYYREYQRAQSNLDDTRKALSDINNLIIGTRDKSTEISFITKQFDQLLATFGLTRDTVKETNKEVDKLLNGGDEEPKDSRVIKLLNERNQRILDLTKQRNKTLDDIALDSDKTEEERQKAAIEAEEAFNEEILNEKIKFAQKNLELTKKIAEEDKETTEEERQAIIKAEQEFYNLKLQQNRDFFRDLNKQEEKQLTEEEKRLAERKQRFENLINDVDEVLIKGFDNLAQGQQKRADELSEQVNAINERNNQLRQAALEGNAIASESIAELDRQQAQAAKEREKALRNKQRIEAASAIFSAYAANVQSDSKTPVADTARDAVLITNLINSLTGFFHGTDDTGTGTLKDKYGTITGFTHDNEQVWSKKDRNEVGWRSRDQIKDIVKDWENSTVTESLDYPAAIPKERPSKANNALIGEVKNLRNEVKDLKNAMPEYDVNWNNIIDGITTRVRQGNKTSIKHEAKGKGGIFGK